MRPPPGHHRVAQFVVVVVSVLVLAVAGACVSGDGAGSNRAFAPETNGRPFVAGSVYPITFLVRRAAGTGAKVENLTKPGFEPHDAELTAGQVRKITQADLVVFLGGHFQPVVERAVSGLGNRALDLLPAAQAEAGDHPDLWGDEGGEAQTRTHGSASAAPHLHTDPHVWLDPQRMRSMNDQVAERLVELLPRQTAAILARAENTDTQLRRLDLSFSRGLETCSRRDFMTGHGAFGYLAERYGLEHVAIGAGVSESEPSAGRLARLALQARSMKIKTVFYERSASPGLATTLAAEIRAKTAILDSIETEPPEGDYISAMQRNLRALRKALGCR